MDNLFHQGLQVKNKRGKLSKETPIMMWISCVTTDMERLGQSQDDELDKKCWRNQSQGQYANPGLQG